MRENGVRKIWAEGGAVVNGWLSIPDSFAAESVSHTNFDSITVDMQHGMVDYQSAVGMLQGISTTDKTPLVRVPWNDPIPIMKVLDAGAYGIVCPMINNREEAERFVGACRYYPDGYRSFGPIRAGMYAGPDYYQHANATVITLAMIETGPALENLDEIMSTPGLDGIYIGPSDLAISLGHPPAPDPSIPEVVDTIETILATAQRHNIAPGIHCASGDMAKRMIAKGFRFCTISNEVRLMMAKCNEEVAVAKGAGDKSNAGGGRVY